MSEWIQHVKRFQQANGCSYKDALKHASATYQRGSGFGTVSKNYASVNPVYNAFSGKGFRQAMAGSDEMTIMPVTQKNGWDG